MIAVVMEGKSTQTRPVSPKGIKPFHARPPDLRHPLDDEFAQFAWSADVGLTTPSVVAQPVYIFYDRRNVTSATEVPGWEYCRKYHNGKASQWMVETEILSSFNRPQLDGFHARGIWTTHTCLKYNKTPRENAHSPFREDALRLFPIGTTVVKESGSRTLSD